MHDAPLEAHEHTEHLAHEGGLHDGFVSRLAVLVAGLAVLAAVAGNLESIETAAALTETGEATLSQDEATDAWGEYQADSLKRHLYTLAGDLNPAAAARYAKIAKEQSGKQADIRARAVAAQNKRGELLAESKQHEARHHWLTGAATLFEIAIALATVSLVTRKKWLWVGSAALGIGGLVLLTTAFV
jgi:hypothetical protein